MCGAFVPSRNAANVISGLCIVLIDDECDGSGGHALPDRSGAARIAILAAARVVRND